MQKKTLLQKMATMKKRNHIFWNFLLLYPKCFFAFSTLKSMQKRQKKFQIKKNIYTKKVENNKLISKKHARRRIQKEVGV